MIATDAHICLHYSPHYLNYSYKNFKKYFSYCKSQKYIKQLGYHEYINYVKCYYYQTSYKFRRKLKSFTTRNNNKLNFISFIHFNLRLYE